MAKSSKFSAFSTSLANAAGQQYLKDGATVWFVGEDSLVRPFARHGRLRFVVQIPSRFCVYAHFENCTNPLWLVEDVHPLSLVYSPTLLITTSNGLHPFLMYLGPTIYTPSIDHLAELIDVTSINTFLDDIESLSSSRYPCCADSSPALNALLQDWRTTYNQTLRREATWQVH